MASATSPRTSAGLPRTHYLLDELGEQPRRYERALNFFSEEEVAEAFAATHSVTMPSQSRNLMKKERPALLARFRELAPARRPIAIQRWSWRRIALTIGVAVASLIALWVAGANLPGAGLLPAPIATTASFGVVTRTPECGSFKGDQLVLEAQSVPTAELLPCIASLPVGWTFRSMEVTKGATILSLLSDRVGGNLYQPHVAVEVTLRATCNTSEATEVPSDEPRARRFEEVRSLDESYVGRRYYVFPGGCVTYRFDIAGRGGAGLANEVSLGLSLFGRDDVHRHLRLKGLELWTPSA